MKITINEEILAKYNLSLTEYLYLLFIQNKGDTTACINSLINKGWGNINIFNNKELVLSKKDEDTLAGIVIDSEKISQEKHNDFEALAIKLMELYPEGKKPGTTYKWRGSVLEITRKLKNLVARYGCIFTEEQAIKATKEYVQSFNGDYRYMKLLKYFLLKAPKNNNGDVEIESEFMAYLENEGSTNINNNWTTELK